MTRQLQSSAFNNVGTSVNVMLNQVRMNSSAFLFEFKLNSYNSIDMHGSSVSLLSHLLRNPHHGSRPTHSHTID